TGKRKLISVHSQSETMATCSRKDLPRFVSRKHLLLAKHVAVFSQLRTRNLRQHLVDQKRDVFIALCTILRRNTVRPKKCRHVPKRRFLIEPLDRTKDLEFIFERQPVT